MFCCIIITTIICRYLLCCKSVSYTFYQNSGFIFGTQYHITYKYTENLENLLIQNLETIDDHLSAFNSHSTLSLINQNKNNKLDRMTEDVIQLALNISEITNGAFDITVAPLVNAYGFGFKNIDNITPSSIDSLMKNVGYKNISINDHKLKKISPDITLDCSGIAKGYACDVIADFFDKLQIKDYLIEIGGEIRAKGKNRSNAIWKIGISDPREDSTHNIPQHSVAMITASNTGIATSGNYRNFYYKDGRKYAHTIDPRTGLPAESDILSATVIAPTCAEADAYATAFMVLGLESSKKILSEQKHLLAYFIYTAETGENKIWTNNKTSIP